MFKVVLECSLGALWKPWDVIVELCGTLCGILRGLGDYNALLHKLEASSQVMHFSADAKHQLIISSIHFICHSGLGVSGGRRELKMVN